MASLIEQWENEIVQQIATALGSAVDVAVLPEKTVDFKKVVTDKSIVNVCYSSAEFQPTKSTWDVIQDSMESFQITIRARFRRDVNGIWDLREKIRIAVVGFKPSSCGKISLKKFEFENFEENLWTYSLTVNCPSMIVEDFAPEPGPPISSITAGEPTITPTS